MEQGNEPNAKGATETIHKKEDKQHPRGTTIPKEMIVSTYVNNIQTRKIVI